MKTPVNDKGNSPVAGVVMSEAGRFIELVETPLGEMVAVLVRGISGDEADPDELDAQRAFEWGQALAVFHAASTPPQPASDSC